MGSGLVFGALARGAAAEVDAGRHHFRRQLSKITAGIKTGEKDNPKPLVEKVAEAKPVDDTVGKITTRKRS